MIVAESNRKIRLLVSSAQVKLSVMLIDDPFQALPLYFSMVKVYV
jgi:hypothetical protein